MMQLQGLQQLLLVSLVLIASGSTVSAQVEDYTCDYLGDRSSDCVTLMDGICDDPRLGGSGGDECKNHDCVDCNSYCQQYEADCYGCVNAKGCHYCPEDGTCDNSVSYRYSRKESQCANPSDYLSLDFGNKPSDCIRDDAETEDPLYEGSKWMFDMINLVDVWNMGLTGNGITIRINDNGVNVENKEFDGRFDVLQNSCAEYGPGFTDSKENHGTAVAGIILGNADNDHCGVGIAPEAQFSSCNFYATGRSFEDLNHKLDTFEISQNSFGQPACTDKEGISLAKNIIYDEGCPFLFQSEYTPCESCDGEFRESNRALSNKCSSAITKHCKYYYKEDGEACADFLEIIVGGGCDYDKLDSSAARALEKGITEGRGGKGTIFTFASGNSFREGDDVNFSGFTNSRYTITVGAVGKDGLHADYSTPGAALMVTAPVGGSKDIGHLMTAGLNGDTCADSGQGTSFACPVVSGVIALILEANPDLSWRDVQGILAQTSQKVDDEEDVFNTVNGAGYWHSNWYGFGIIDAKAAVEAAMKWKLFPEELQAIGESIEENAIISDGENNEFVSTITLDAGDFVAESTVVLIDLAHYNRGDLEIELVSPLNTKSILHPGKRAENTQLEGDERWKLMTLRNWGEDPSGAWKLIVRDLVDREETLDKNIFRDWKLVVYGRSTVVEENEELIGEENEELPSREEEQVTTPPDEDEKVDDEESKESVDEAIPDSEDGILKCESAMPIASSMSPIEGTISQDPLDTSKWEGPCITGLETVGGWYQAIGNGNIFTMTACSLDASKSVGISVFTGFCSESECISHLSRQIADCETGFGHTISFASEPGKPYNVFVSGLPVGADLAQADLVESSQRHLEDEQQTDFRLDFVETEVIQNSKCGTAKPATFDASVEGSTLGLLTAFKTCQNTEKSGAWYSVEGGTPKEDGVIVYEVNTCNPQTNFYNSMSVYRGDGCGDHECVNVDVLPCPSGWFGQQVFWSTGLQENYQVFVHSSDAIEAKVYDAGSFRMDIQYNDRLPNDQCAAALEIDMSQEGTVKGVTSGAKPDMVSIENSSCGVGNAGAWYKVTGTGGVLQASTCSTYTNHKTGIQVFSGKCDSLTCIDSVGGNKVLCNDGSGSVVNFRTDPEVDYFILVTGRREGKTGRFGLQVKEIATPENNDCSAAVTLIPEESSTVGSTKEATVDFANDRECGVPLDSPGVWYEIEGTGRGIEISTCQKNDYDSAISIFHGTSCGTLECVSGTSAIDTACTDGKGVRSSFFGEKGKKYKVYVHGKSGSPTNMGDFTLSYNEFQVLQKNEFCEAAREIEDTNGFRTSGSTEDATQVSIPDESCGVPITNPGLWYYFTGNGQPFQIEACARDEGDFDVSVSIFVGECSELTCLTGTTFIDNVCSTVKDRSLQAGGSPSAIRFMTENNQKYHVFVHGTGVGDFDMYVLDENVAGFGTMPPTETPLLYGKDLYRWMPEEQKSLNIATDYLNLKMIVPPEGNVTISSYMINYQPPEDFKGEDVMYFDGCENGECFRFALTVSVMGERFDPNASEGWNKLWLLMLLLLLVLCCALIPIYYYYKKKKEEEEEDYDDESRSEGYDDESSFADEDDEKGLMKGDAPDSSGDDWESSDDDDEDFEGSYDSRDQESGSESGSDGDDSGSDEDSSGDGFNDEYR